MKRWMMLGLFVAMMAVPFSNIAYANHGGCHKSQSCCSKQDQGCSYGKKSEECPVMQKAHCLLESKEELGLSADQVKKIQDLKLNLKKEMIRKEAELKVLKVDLMAAMKSDDWDVDAMNKLIDQKFDLKKQMMKSGVAAKGQLMSILTDDQKAKMEELKSGRAAY